MSRIIKFRIWYKPTDQFIHNISIGQSIIQHDSENFVVLGFEDCIIQQFTGLLDKKGVEIYEGDIVKCRGLNTYETVTIKDIRSIPVQVSAWPSIYGKGNGDCEVIGNIHLNQEPHN
jgi:YopX protein